MVLKVLCPLDGSDRSMLAMERALRMLRPAKPQVTLLCIWEDAFEHASEDVVEVFDDDDDDEVFPTAGNCEAMLKRAVGHAKKAGVPVHTKILAGGVRKNIIEEANNGYDLLVMHRLDRSQVKEKFRTSATEHIARRVACSVLLVDDP